MSEHHVCEQCDSEGEYFCFESASFRHYIAEDDLIWICEAHACDECEGAK